MPSLHCSAGLTSLLTMIRALGRRKKKIVLSDSLENDKDPIPGRQFVEIKKMMEAKNKFLSEESNFHLYYLCINNTYLGKP